MVDVEDIGLRGVLLFVLLALGDCELEDVVAAETMDGEVGAVELEDRGSLCAAAVVNAAGGGDTEKVGPAVGVGRCCGCGGL